MSQTKSKGRLIIVGGHENKVGERQILEEVARTAQANGNHLVLMTVATEAPDKMAQEYTKVFQDLGVGRIEVLDIRSRDDASDPKQVQKLEDAPVIFFTGGDQLRLTSQVGDSLVYQSIKKILEAGGTIVGTSAGAAAMPATMLVSGNSDESPGISAIEMAPGLDLIPNIVVDSHFAQRGRFGRLLGAVTQNPRNLGIGIDENTAIVVEGSSLFRVLGSGAVYVMDGSEISYSSLSEKNPEGIMSIYDVKLHVLSKNDCFDLETRRPTPGESGEPEQEPEKPEHKEEATQK